MLDFMFLFNSSVNTLYNEGTANIQCYILKKFLLLIYIIDTKKYFWWLCYSFCFYTSILSPTSKRLQPAINVSYYLYHGIIHVYN